MSETAVLETDFKEQLKAAYRKTASLEKLLKELIKDPHFEDLKLLKNGLTKIEKDGFGLGKELEELHSQLDSYRRQQEQERPRRFGRELKEAAENENLPFAPLTSSPPCYRLGLFTVEPDFKKAKVKLCYARLPVGEAELSPQKVMASYHQSLAILEKTDIEPEEFLSRLHTAYRKTLVAAGRRPGERVELVDLLPDLALLHQSAKFMKDPLKENFRPYGRVRLAWDLGRLRREGVLEHKGRRVTLGTATIGTTKKKDRVLYLEGPGGKGQYYLSLAFMEAR